MLDFGRNVLLSGSGITATKKIQNQCNKWLQIQHSEVKAYRMLLEEFKVSVYAQELGTAQKVSEKRLDKLADSLERQFK